jgi:hypothetical protein
MTFQDMSEEEKYELWSTYVEYRESSGFPALDYVPWCETMEEQ